MALGRVGSFAKFLRELRAFYAEPITLDQARSIVRRGLEEREANFLRFVSKTIFGRPTSPYIPLLRNARCEFGDLESSVNRNGLEATLLELRRAGVYVSFEEFKGREPIVRDGLVVEASPGDFDNPLARSGYRTQTSGSTGTSIPSWVSVGYLASRVPSTMLSFASKDIVGVPSAIWRESLPGPSIGLILEDAKIGQCYDRWFAPPLKRSLRARVASGMATELIVRTARSAGVRLPRPEPLAYDQAVVAAGWAERRLAERGRCLFRAGVSNAVRVASAAGTAGIDLTGLTFLGGGEPVTRPKVEAIERGGAKWMSGYAISEVGRVGVACTRATDPSDVHFLKNAAALIPFPRRIPGSTRAIDVFNFTSILDASPKILLNAELDDYGILETRRCGCPIEEAGFDEHIRDIYSFRKLTGEGVTLVGSDMLRILDEVLPARFGGSAVDYQLVEEEDETGLTRLVLLVSPRISLGDEHEVITTVLRELGSSGLARDVRSVWGQANSLRVRRADPEVSLGGKVRPLTRRGQQNRT